MLLTEGTVQLISASASGLRNVPGALISAVSKNRKCSYTLPALSSCAPLSPGCPETEFESRLHCRDHLLLEVRSSRLQIGEWLSLRFLGRSVKFQDSVLGSVHTIGTL